MKKYWLIIIDWDGDVDYGVERSSYLAGIYTSRKAAEKALKSDEIKSKIKEIKPVLTESEWDWQPPKDGDCYARIMEFDSFKHPNSCFLGGGSYQE